MDSTALHSKLTRTESVICKNMEPIVNIRVQHFYDYHKPLARVIGQPQTREKRRSFLAPNLLKLSSTLEKTECQIRRRS